MEAIRNAFWLVAGLVLGAAAFLVLNRFGLATFGYAAVVTALFAVGVFLLVPSGSTHTDARPSGRLDLHVGVESRLDAWVAQEAPRGAFREDSQSLAVRASRDLGAPIDRAMVARAVERVRVRGFLAAKA